MKKDPMTRDEIENALNGWVSDATTYLDAELSPDRAQATNFYRGDKFGNEEAGRSQFIFTDVRDTVLAMLPSLVRMFFPTSGRVVEYQPRPKVMDEQQLSLAVLQAEQASEYVNSVVLEADNDGFLEFYAAIKDALVRRIGYIKYWWEDRSQYKSYTADNLDVNQYDALAQDPDVEIQSVQEKPDVSGIVLRDVKYKHWRRDGVCKIKCGPPEELLISRDARDRDTASFIAHRTEKTRGELIAMGVDPEEIDQYGGSYTEVTRSLEEIARRGGISVADKAMEPAGQKNLWIEAYPFLDVDGDGIAELVKVRCLGPACHLIGDPEPVDERPFAIGTPDPEPHVLIGGSVAERVADLQLMKSSLMRAGADSLSQSIFPDTYYMEGYVNRQAMESTAIGKRIPVQDGVQPANAVYEFRHEFQGDKAIAMIDYLDKVKLGRVGPLPATLDPDALQSTPEVGVKATVQAASEQLELIARVLAGTMMKQLFRGILKLLVEHQPRARIVRLRGAFVPVDPRAWDADMDVSVNVALGTEAKLTILAANAAKQEQILQTLGPDNPMVGLGQLRHTYATMLELSGFQDVTRFWKPLPLDYTPPPAPPQPSAEMMLAQAELAKAQASIQKGQLDLAAEQLKLQQDKLELISKNAVAGRQLELQQEEMHLVDDRERDKAEADIVLRTAELNAKYGILANTEQIRADLEEKRIAADVLIADKKTRQKPEPVSADTQG